MHLAHVALLVISGRLIVSESGERGSSFEKASDSEKKGFFRRLFEEQRRRRQEEKDREAEDGFTAEEEAREGMPAQWEFRFHQDGPNTGQQVQLIKMCRSGMWTCLTPLMQVTTINTRARTAVTATARPGIAYTHMPPLTAASKALRVSASDQLIAAGLPVQAGLAHLQWRVWAGEGGGC